MTQGGFGLDPDEPPPRRRLLWPLLAGLVVVLGFVVAVVVYEATRSTDVEDSAPPIRTSTTFAGSPLPTGDAGKDLGATATKDACSEIPQAFPLSPRGCRIAIPPDLASDEQVPAVVLLHGLNTSSEQVASHGRWRDAAVEHRFVLVLPEGQGASWNAGGCCAVAQSLGIDDVGYLRSVVGQLSDRPEVDPERIFVVGESNGGMMAYTFACAASDIVAGVASVEGTPVGSCRPGRNIRAMHVHGLNDQTVPYKGGQSVVSWFLGVQFRAVPDAFADVARAMGCQGTPERRTDGHVITDDFPRCPQGVRARLVSINGIGHAWPRGEPFDATEEILSFFDVAT